MVKSVSFVALSCQFSEIELFGPAKAVSGEGAGEYFGAACVVALTAVEYCDSPAKPMDRNL